MLDADAIAALVDELAEPLVERFRAELRSRLMAAVPAEIGAAAPVSPAAEASESITESELAVLAGISKSGMEKARARGKSPPWRTEHGIIVYDKKHAFPWIEQRIRHGLVRKSQLSPMVDEDDDA